MQVTIIRMALLLGMALGIAGLGAGCATCPGSPNAERSQSGLKEKWGIEVTSLRLSANGRMIDFRYRVFDPAKAATLGDPHSKPCLIDQATGARLKVPNMPKIGPLRQTATRLEAGKIYFALFANAGLVVKSGCKVTVEIGDFRAENLTVE